MPKLPVLKAPELIKALKRLGFYEHHQVGSHLQLRHPDGRRTTVPCHPKKEIKKGTLRGVLSDANISTDDLLKNL